MSTQTDAYEIIGDPTSRSPFVFTCEHATNRLPGSSPSPADSACLEEHWGFDIGAADVTRRLTDVSGAVAVLSRFSRLLCDPNRTPDEPTFVVERIGDHVLDLNRGVDRAERERRRDAYYGPYHEAIDDVLRAQLAHRRDTRLVSIHSFTPTWEGTPRRVEIGVLFDAHEAIAETLYAALRDEGFEVARNEPYSGYAGLIHAARRHGQAFGIPYLELEIRQDLIATTSQASVVADRVAKALARLEPSSS